LFTHNTLRHEKGVVENNPVFAQPPPQRFGDFPFTEHNCSGGTGWNLVKCFHVYYSCMFKAKVWHILTRCKQLKPI